MGRPKERVQYPQLQGAEQHHQLKNDPGKKGDQDHMNDDVDNEDKGTQPDK